MGNLVTKKEGNIGTDVFDLGPAKVMGGITDNNLFDGARWIWNTSPDPKRNQLTNVIIKFSKSFIYTGPTVVGKYNICVDDIGYIDCNSYPIINNGGKYNNITNCSGGWGNTINKQYTGITKDIQILKGTNRVNIYAMNIIGAAGVIARIGDKVKTLEISDGSWKSKIVNSYQNVIELGDVNSNPMGKPDATIFKTAQYIWSDKNTSASTSVNNTSPHTYVKFSYVFYYKTINGISEEGKCTIAVNDACYLYMNCETVNSGESQYFLKNPSINVKTIKKDIPITYVEGINFIDIIVKNTQPSSSLIGAFYKKDGNTLGNTVVTNKQWTYSIIPFQKTIGNVQSIYQGLDNFLRFKKPIMASCYPDISTYVIWNTSDNKYPVNDPIIFTYTFDHKGESTTGYCYIVLNGTCEFYMNNDKKINVSYGGLLFTEESQKNTYRDQNTYNEFKLNQGTNTIKIVSNTPFLASFYDNNDNIIAYTNKSWNYSMPSKPINIPSSFKKMNEIEGFALKKNQIEPFSLMRKEGFVNLTTWNFPNSSDWYKVVQNGYSIKMSETGIKLPTRDYSISFLYKLTGSNNAHNNIFHITNTGNDHGNNGDRIPAMWVNPNETSFHIKFSTDKDFNDGYNWFEPIPLNQITLITLVFENNLVSIYYGNKLIKSETFENIHLIKPSATLWIGDPWYRNNGTIQIKGFTIYDGVLTQEHVNNLFLNMQKGDSGIDGVPGKDGAVGKNGTPGTNGVPGNPGKDGINGAKGDPGTAGKDGTPGANGQKGDPGKDGAAGKNGAIGQKGDPGIPGEKGEKGARGPPGANSSKSSLNPTAIPLINKKIDRVLTRTDVSDNSYAYCLGGTIKCDDSNVVPITDEYSNSGAGNTYSFRCSNDSAQAYCSNGILESNERAYLSPFPFSNSLKGFTVETKEKSPYVYDLATNNILYYSNQQYVTSDDICNVLTNKKYSEYCNKINVIEPE